MSGPTFAEVLAATVELIKPEFATEWLRMKNQMLDGRAPVELVEAGEGQRVLDLIDFLASGSFA